jgi:T4 RnlA family RNA ligase
MYTYIKNIKDVLPHLEGRKEFLVRQAIDEPSLTIIDYLVKKKDTFPVLLETDTPEEVSHKMVFRECRGIKFDTETGDIKVRPHIKFFNLNECAESQKSNIDWSQEIFMMEKLDGSMINHYFYTNPDTKETQLHFHTTMGYTGVAKKVNKFLEENKLLDKYSTFCKEAENLNMTPIFEFCGQEQKIVVDYNETNLVLTAMRDLNTGKYLNPDNLKKIADQFNIPCVNFINFKNIDELLEKLENSKYLEGYILGFVNKENPDFTNFIKLKCNWYVGIHKALENISIEAFVWELVINKQIDDIIPKLFPVAAAKLIEFNDNFMDNVLTNVDKYRAICEDLSVRFPIRKDLAIYLNKEKQYSTFDKNIIFNYFNGKEIKDTIMELIQKNYNNLNTIDSVRQFVGGIKWKYNTSDEIYCKLGNYS